MRISQRGVRIQRASHAGVPISSSGAAMIEYTVCCTMCTENKYRSPRSWIGQSDATSSAKTPAEKVAKKATKKTAARKATKKTAKKATKKVAKKTVGKAAKKTAKKA